MKVKLTLLMLLSSAILIAQNGINYKALIKDTNGDIIANQGVDMVFTIEIEGESSYSELQQIVTDGSGIAIATIGIGSVLSGDFDTIDWDRGDAQLNVQIDFGSGLVDFGNTAFNAVPYALHTLNKEGLEAIDEGNGIGWRLTGRATAFYGSIGNNAVDLSWSVTDSQPFGATGTGSFASGAGTIASGNYSFTSGLGNQALSTASVALGQASSASGSVSFSGGLSVDVSGEQSLGYGFDNNITARYAAALGRGLEANAESVAVFGRFNVGGGNPSSWSASEPLFEIGNGSSNADRRNALTIYKTGFHTIDSQVSGLRINSQNTGLAISNTGGPGINIDSGSTYGILMTNTSNDGIRVVNAQNYGGYFIGDTAGVYANNSNLESPDIILGGTFPITDNSADDGIIATPSALTSSDMFLRSYDAVVVELDYDNNEAGNFRIRNGNQDVIFDVNESGNLDINGRLRIGTETIEDTGSDRLEFNAHVLPDNDNQFTLGWSDHRWSGVFAVNGTINTSDRREKKNIKELNYGLAEILQMQPVRFNWKNKNNPDTKLGLIAQDLQLVIPEVVKSHTWERDAVTGALTKTELERLGVYYSDLVPVLIKAIQEQQKIIENQTEALRISNSNYEALLSRVEILESKSSN